MRTNHITSPPVSAPYVHHLSSDIAGDDGNTMTPRDRVDQLETSATQTWPFLGVEHVTS
jgi:hypothetical protein